MIAHVAWGRLKEGSWPEFERLWMDVVLPTVDEIPGLQRRILLHSTEERDEGISISYWDDAESVQRYESEGARSELSAHFDHLYSGEWWLKTFEVVGDAGP